MNTIVKLFFVVILFTSFSSDEIRNLNSIIPDFQVNENYSISKIPQYYSSITSDGSGNFIITWYDYRNGNADIYAQRYSREGVAIDSNFRVNDDLGSESQFWPAISTNDSGNFIITWMDRRNERSGDIYVQRYASDGTALDSNFKVNDDLSDASQEKPSIAVDDSANFVITWADERNGNWDIYAQRYASDGAALDSNFKVNNYLGSVVRAKPAIAADDSGNFIITWSDSRNGNADIYAQRYSREGVAIDSNFRVNDDQGDAGQYGPSIAVDDSGNFIITWGDIRNGNADIYAQRYSREGFAIDSNFRVNDDQGSAWQNKPTISTDDSGNFIITWGDKRNINWDIYAQRFASDGTALGSNFQVNDDLYDASQSGPSIAVDDSGNFIITWEDERSITWDIYAQRYASDGTALGSNFQANDDQGDAGQYGPSIAVDDSGNFIITWRDERNGNTDIYAQRYASDGTALDSNFRVNDDLGNERQYFPAISTDKIGNFIITWGDECYFRFNFLNLSGLKCPIYFFTFS